MQIAPGEKYYAKDKMWRMKLIRHHQMQQFYDQY